MSGKSKSQASKLGNDTQAGGNSGVDAAQQPCPLAQQPALVVKVTCDVGGNKAIAASVSIAGPAGNALDTQPKTGVADFGKVVPGSYAVSVASIAAPDDADFFVLPASTENVTLAAGDKKTVVLKVDRKNVVTPKLELEYKVVLLDRGLAALQDAAERLADADRQAALFACCGLLGVPMIAFSSAELGADVGGIAFAALALYFVLCPLRPAVAMPLAGLCAGLAFGFKSLHLISAVAIGLLACARGAGLPGALRNGARFGGVALLCGGFWLLRNALAFGNPLHPVGVPLVGAWLGWLPAADFDTALRATTQLEWVDSTWQWLVYPWTETQRYGQNFKHSAGLGAFVAAVLPATAAALAAAFARDGIARHRIRAALLCAVLFIVAAWWLLGDRQPRYVLAALAPAMPLAAWTLTQAAGPWRRVFDTVLIVCIVAMLGVFLSRQVLQFGDRIVLSRQTARAAFYEYPELVDMLPAGATILNLADRSWHYPLAGAALSNRVVSMPQGRRLLGLPPSLTAPRAVTLAAAPLRAAGVTHLFVAGTALSIDACVRLDEAARLDRNPVNGMPLGSPRVLYAVHYPCH